MTLARLAGSIAVPLALFATPRPAAACSPPVCPGGYVIPADGAAIPASAPGLVWHPIEANDEVSALRLSRAGDPDEPVPFHTSPLSGAYQIIPDEPLVAGATYHLVDSSTCLDDHLGPSATFTVTAAVPQPTALGALTTSAVTVDSLLVATVSGSCTSSVTAAQATLELALDADAIPWSDLLQFQTYVDGEAWGWSQSLNGGPESPPTGHGHDRIFHICHSDDPGALMGLSEGTHVVRIDATLPGSTVALASNEVTVDLSCDANSGSNDTGSNDDGGDTAGDDDGGDCNATGASPTPFALALVALVGLSILGVRRRLWK